MKPGDCYTYHHKGHRVNYLIVLLSSDKIPGWETNEELWRCAQFQIGERVGLFGAQIVIHTESELQEMDRTRSIGI